MTLFADDSLVDLPNSDLTTAAGSGIGIAPSGPDPLRAAVDGIDSGSAGVSLPTKRSSLRDEVRTEFQSLGPLQKFGAALGEFGAGVTGRPSPLRARIDEKRKEKLLQMEELKGTVTALEHGISMRQGMSGDDAAAFDEAYGNKLEDIQPGMKQTFLALTKKPDLLTQFQAYAPYLPEPVQAMMKGQPKEFLKFAGTAEGMKVMMDAKDRFDMRTATKKVQTAMMGMQQFVPPEELKKIMADGVITASDVIAIQKYVPDAAKLSDIELGAIQRNDKVFWQGLGVLHGQSEQDVLKRRADTGDKGKQPPTVHVDGKVYQFDPEQKLSSPRLGTDSRYALLGSGKDAEDQGKVFEREFKLSDDYRQDTKKFAERRPLFDSTTDYMANRATEKTSAGDAALAFAYAKMRDPNDRLAVSETRDLVKLGNIFERLGVNISGVLDKGETLPDRVAEQMYKEIRRNFTEQNSQQLKTEAAFAKKTKDYGGNPERVVRSYAIPEEQLNPKRRDSDKPKGGEQEYADPGAVRTAFTSGKINREQAKAALKKFGFN